MVFILRRAFLSHFYRISRRGPCGAAHRSAGTRQSNLAPHFFSAQCPLRNNTQTVPRKCLPGGGLCAVSHKANRDLGTSWFRKVKPFLYNRITIGQLKQWAP